MIDNNELNNLPNKNIQKSYIKFLKDFYMYIEKKLNKNKVLDKDKNKTQDTLEL